MITFTNLVILKTDQVLISFTIGVGCVALYQVGYKAAEVFGNFSKQLHEALSSAAAHLGYEQPRLGSGIPYSVPRGTYRCADNRWVAISTSAGSRPSARR